MSETIAAPAAPVVAINGATNGATTIQAPSPAQSGTVPRGPDGKFVSKGVTTDGTQAAPSEALPPEFVYEDELEVNGQRKQVRMSKEELRRALQVKSYLEAKHKDIHERGTKLQQLERFAKEDPEAFFRELGVDPDEFARQRVLARARMEAMTEEQRQAYEYQQEVQRLRAELEGRTKQEEEFKAQQQRQELVRRNKHEFEAALTAGKLPKNHATLYVLADIQDRTLRAGKPRLEPQALAQVAYQEIVAQNQTINSGFEGEQLLEVLGADVVKRVLQAEYARWQKNQAYSATPVSQTQATSSTEPPKYIDEHEAARRLREFKNGSR